MQIELLKEEMAKKDMNGIKLSRATGVSPSTISRCLSGKRGLSMKDAKKIAVALNLSATKTKSIFFE